MALRCRTTTDDAASGQRDDPDAGNTGQPYTAAQSRGRTGDAASAALGDADVVDAPLAVLVPVMLGAAVAVSE